MMPTQAPGSHLNALVRYMDARPLRDLLNDSHFSASDTEVNTHALVAAQVGACVTIYGNAKQREVGSESCCQFV